MCEWMAWKFNFSESAIILWVREQRTFHLLVLLDSYKEEPSQAIAKPDVSCLVIYRFCVFKCFAFHFRFQNACIEQRHSVLCIWNKLNIDMTGVRLYWQDEWWGDFVLELGTSFFCFLRIQHVEFRGCIQYCGGWLSGWAAEIHQDDPLPSGRIDQCGWVELSVAGVSHNTILSRELSRLVLSREC